MAQSDDASATRARRDHAHWFRGSGYGLFVHWHENSAPVDGAKLPYPDAVERFPVEAFADQVAEAGAAYVIFTVTHILTHLPFPLPYMDRLLPGRTCRRDLMADLYEALSTRGIRLLFYHSWQACGDPQLAEVSGWQRDLDKWQEIMCDLVSAIGTRYGQRLSGWWIDNCRPDKWDGWMSDYDFTRMADALRTGSDRRMLAFNISGPAPPVPPPHDWRLAGVADYTAGHLHDELLVADAPTDAHGLQSHWCNNMDTRPRWYFKGDNRTVRFTDNEVVSAVSANVRNGAVFSYGVAPPQRGLIVSETMRQLRTLRLAVRGR